MRILLKSRVFEFLKQIGSEFIQFIPLVERESNNTDVLAGPDESFANMTKWSVGALQYGQFLSTIFEHWVRHDVGKVFVQSFESTLASWLDQPAGICVFSKQCGHMFALEANGDLYQCDHYVYPEYRLGNIHRHSIAKLNQSKEAIDFGENKSRSLNKNCQHCRYRFACHGGCPKHRFELGPNGKPDHNYLCQGYIHYFEQTETAMKAMKQLINDRQPVMKIMDLFHE